MVSLKVGGHSEVPLDSNIAHRLTVFIQDTLIEVV